MGSGSVRIRPIAILHPVHEATTLPRAISIAAEKVLGSNPERAKAPRDPADAALEGGCGHVKASHPGVGHVGDLGALGKEKNVSIALRSGGGIPDTYRWTPALQRRIRGSAQILTGEWRACRSAKQPVEASGVHLNQGRDRDE